MQVPLHCIGIQAYLHEGIPGDEGNRVTPEMMKYRLDKLGSLNLSMYITEFLWKNTTEAQMEPMFNQWVQLWFSHPKLKGMLLWKWW